MENQRKKTGPFALHRNYSSQMQGTASRPGLAARGRREKKKKKEGSCSTIPVREKTASRAPKEMAGLNWGKGISRKKKRDKKSHSNQLKKFLLFRGNQDSPSCTVAQKSIGACSKKGGGEEGDTSEQGGASL